MENVLIFWTVKIKVFLGRSVDLLTIVARGLKERAREAWPLGDLGVEIIGPY